MVFDFRLLGRPGMVVPFAERFAATRALDSARSARPSVPPKVAPRAVTALADDDESDRADFANPKMRAVAQREKERMLAILMSPAGIRNPQVAVNIATMTALPRSRAIQMIEDLERSLPSTGASAESLARRIVRAGNRRRGEEPMAPSTVKQGEGRRATAAEILAAGRKARGET